MSVPYTSKASTEGRRSMDMDYPRGVIIAVRVSAWNCENHTGTIVVSYLPQQICLLCVKRVAGIDGPVLSYLRTCPLKGDSQLLARERRNFMSNGKDDGIIEKGKDVIDKVSGAIDETIPNETPDVKPDHTGTQDDVQKLINEVPQGQQAACRESCKKQEKTRTWRVWDWKLEKSLGQDFEGEIVLKWECDCCYIYKVRAWHHTTINTVPVVPNLKVKTPPATP